MVKYCTVDDVLGVAQKYVQDVQRGAVHEPGHTDLITEATVEAIIEEASEMIAGRYSPRYSRAVIEGFGEGLYPPVIVYYTKTLTAVYMTERYSAMDADSTKAMVQIWGRSMEHYQAQIANGALYDTTETRVPTYTDPELLHEDGDWTDELEDVFDERSRIC